MENFAGEAPDVGFPSKTAHPAFLKYKVLRSLRRAAKGDSVPLETLQPFKKKVDEN